MNNKTQGKERSGVRGYVTHQEFGGLRIPATVQNLVMRDYTSRNNLLFKLSLGEYFFPNCYVQLNGLIKELPTLEGAVMCSLFMLPKNPSKRIAIYKEFIGQDAALHLVFESLVIRKNEDIEKAENIFLLNDTLRQCLTTIPRELLQPLGIADFFA